jgi:hypothetical protein
MMQETEQQPEQPRPHLTPEQQATRQAGMRIANALGEKEPGPRAQVGRVVRVLGIERAQALYEQTLEVEAAGGMMLPDGSRRRTPGGVFFKLVRDSASKEERWKIFPRWTQRDKPEQPSQPAQLPRTHGSEMEQAPVPPAHLPASHDLPEERPS